jgi:hypothetical protein
MANDFGKIDRSMVIPAIDDLTNARIRGVPFGVWSPNNQVIKPIAVNITGSAD